MSTSISILSYSDVRELFDRALESPKGVRIQIPDKPGGVSGGSATYFKQRAYKFRSLDRRENSKIYGPGESMHGKSVYDSLVVREGRTKDEVEIVKVTLDGFKVENI